TFLTDYGLENKFVGVCHGVMAKIAPEVRVLDLTHLVPSGNIRHGAEILRQAICYLPDGVHLAVVDPGVGTPRRPVVLVAGANVFVAPDNGLVVPAASEVGGVEKAYELRDPRYRLESISHTFHGRDIFSPVAAHLAAGVEPSEFGPQVPLNELVRLPEQVRRREGNLLHGEVTIMDRFGNLQTSLDTAILTEVGACFGDVFVLTSGATTAYVPYVETFGSVAEGEALAHIDSADRLAVAVNLGSAAARFQLCEGDVITLRLNTG
ncbi:MAG: SAM hydrolase/SAM-dependent halogenase family protein, partial [Pseudonocardiaceae bacterium]